MKLLIFLSSTAGLALLHFAQTILFSLMVYIILAEFLRTRRDDLIYKLVAAANVTLINIATTTILVIKHFYNIEPSQKYYPLIFNSTFAIIVLSLTRAFVYNYIKDKKKFKKIINIGMIMFVFVYIVMQFLWLRIYKTDNSFLHSNLQLLFSTFFILVIFFSIYYIMRFRRKYRFRLIIAFFSIIVVQAINIYGSIYDYLTPGLLVSRSVVPFLVPIMFGSVVFKELIENVVTMVNKLQDVLENQRDIVFELMQIGAGMSGLADSLVKMSIDGWQKLSIVVDNISAQDNDRKNIFEKSDLIIDYVAEMLDSVADINLKNDFDYKNMSIEEMELTDDQKKHHQVIQGISGEIKNFHSILNESCAIFNSFENNLKDILGSINQIEEISDETGMLALNASIEAARAGKRGKGFGVVAQGVAELSDRSQEQTDLLNSYIGNVITNIENYNKKLLAEIKEFQKSYDNVKHLKNYFKDDLVLSKLYENMTLLNTKKGSILQDKSKQINEDIHLQRKLLDNNRKHGEEMKESIRKHISEIEAIAGMSDDLKMMVEKLNLKTNKIIVMVKELEIITG